MEVTSLFRLVRLRLDLGEPDYQDVLNLPQTGILAAPAVPAQAWSYLLHNALLLGSRGAPAGRDGLIRILARCGFKLRIHSTAQAIQLGLSASTTATLARAADGSSSSLPTGAILYPSDLADQELPKLLQKARRRAIFNGPGVNYIVEVRGIAQRANSGDLQLARSSLRSDAIQYAARAVALTANRRAIGSRTDSAGKAGFSRR